MTDVTPVQQARLDEIRAEWMALTLSTERADRPAAEAGIYEAYRLARLPPPKRGIVWFDSPLAAARHLVSLDRSARWWQYVGGNLGAGWCSMIEAYQYLGVKGLEPAAGILAVARVCGPWWPLDELALASDRPVEVHVDAPRRNGVRPLHAEGGPAVRWADGAALYAWHGVRAPADAIEHPEAITVRRVNDERNVEVRRALIEIMGFERWISEAAGSKLHTDEYGTLWSIRVPGDTRDTKIVEVVNSTPEPDGHFKHYYLPVADDMPATIDRSTGAAVPSTRTVPIVRARQAIAHTFGLTEDEYRPRVET